MTRKKSSFDLQTFLATVALPSKAKEYQKGQSVYSQGDAADGVFYLQRGKVQLRVLSSSGKEAIVAILNADSFFGEGCLAGERVRLVSATAVEPSTILKIDQQKMTRVLHERHLFSDVFIRHMLLRNIRVQADLVDQLFNSTEKRLARALLLLAHYGNADKPTIDVPKISQETLAEMIGTTRARVNVFMNKFRKLGFIDYNGELRINSTLLSIVLHE